MRSSISHASKDEFLRDVPRLIIEHNIHGVDIDPRAAQIAGLSLWLRAQRAWKEASVNPADRPVIRKSNIVCAEPMPGEEELLEDFLKSLKEDRLEGLIRRVLHVSPDKQVRATRRMADHLCDLVRRVWEKMQLAGEAGSLLKIEEELQDAIQQGKAEWEEKMPLFRVTEFSLFDAPPKISYLKTVPGEEEDFWNRAEPLVLAALEEYAEQAEAAEAARRRLFVDDAAKGFAFIDLCRKRFDVVLMNPPFGESSKSSKKYLETQYPFTKNDIYAAFVESGVRRIFPASRVGAITSRTGFFLSSFTKWRESIVLVACRPVAVADLGYGVLDAMVETAAYVLEKKHSA